MADFDPKAFLQETDPNNQSFDPKQFLRETAPKPSAWEAARRGAEQGFSYGGSDELKGLLSDNYTQTRDIDREANKAAEANNPWIYGGTKLLGNIGSAAALGLAAPALIPGAVVGGIGAGALQALGESEGRNIGDIVEDTLTGGALGGVAGAAGNLIGKGYQAAKPYLQKVVEPYGKTWLAKKAANVFLNTPEEITEEYIKNPQAVRNAAPRYKVAEDMQEAVDKLKREAIEGSAASRAILSKEGNRFSGDEIADVFGQKANEILERGEGAMTPKQEATFRWLKSEEARFRSPSDGEPRSFSTNKLKDEIQSLDDAVEWELKPGQKAPIDDLIKKDIRKQIDQRLKESSPEYTEQMKKVAADTALVGEAKDLVKNQAALTNRLRKVVTDQYGAGQIPKETFEKLDKRLETDFMRQIDLANAREAFDKSVTNGSMNVNKFSKMAEDIPYVGKILGPVAGATVDKYGRKLTLGAIDAASAAQQGIRTIDNSTIGTIAGQLGKYGKILLDAAGRGPNSVAATDFLLRQTSPEYREMRRRVLGDDSSE